MAEAARDISLNSFMDPAGDPSSFRYFATSAMSSAWSPILSRSEIILIAADTALRSLATGCSLMNSLRHWLSICLSMSSISCSVSAMEVSSFWSGFSIYSIAISIPCSHSSPIFARFSFTASSSWSNFFLISFSFFGKKDSVCHHIPDFPESFTP